MAAEYDNRVMAYGNIVRHARNNTVKRDGVQPKSLELLRTHRSPNLEHDVVYAE